MKSLSYEYLEKQLLSQECVRLIQALGEYKGKQEAFTHQTPQVLETLKQAAIIQSSESSNRIEGVTVVPERFKAIMLDKSKPHDRSEAEILGYRNVLSEIHNHFNTIPINSKTILNLHSKMLKGAGLATGTWKQHDNIIEERLPEGRWITRFVPVSARETPYYMEESCKQLDKLWLESKVSKLLVIASFVFDFLCIHPFTDGNGRLSRLLTVLLLHKAGYEVGRYISLEKIIEDSKARYYDTLHQASENWQYSTHPIKIWWEYFLTTLLLAYQQLEERIGMLTKGRGAKTDLIIATINNLSSSFRISDLEQACPTVGRDMIRVVLNRLRTEGKLNCHGTGRGAKWHKV
ncbi:MAG: Fic family protein [Gammaproteobacteria bacterium]|nr:Fic family protein [Gammaproteobacteria bacterium]